MMFCDPGTNSIVHRAFLEDLFRSWVTDSSSSSAMRYLSWWLRRRTALAFRNKSIPVRYLLEFTCWKNGRRKRKWTNKDQTFFLVIQICFTQRESDWVVRSWIHGKGGVPVSASRCRKKYTRGNYVANSLHFFVEDFAWVSSELWIAHVGLFWWRFWIKRSRRCILGQTHISQRCYVLLT